MCLHLFSIPGAAERIDWLPRARDAWGPPPTPRLDPAPLRGRLLGCLSPVSRSASLSLPCNSPAGSAPSPSPRSGLRIFPGRCQGDKPIPGK